ncbi:MAG: hypothetical protein ISS28_03500 [Candidatus Cloacimonetes bacterium]|nr:hypothetical protein [Candidatus Cloacimonadota bacterium]MBL7086157.1 hypothetical protein [Candidatus Cloacimonadota bacterium]
MKTRKLALMVTLAIILLVSNVWAEKYAVLITGDYADSARANYNGSWAIANNLDRDRRPMQEFWNDTFLMWEMLVFEKGYSDENVFVLFAGGMDYPIDPDANCPAWWDERYFPQQLYPELFPYPGDQITDYPADIANVNNVFTNLANTANEDDFLFVWTFDQIKLPNFKCKVKVFDAKISKTEKISEFLDSIK